MQIQKQQIKNSITVRSFNQIQIQPTTITSMYYCQQQNNLYISRQKSSQIYHISQNKSTPLSSSQLPQLTFTHLTRLPWSKHILCLNSIIFIFRPFQLIIYQQNSYTTHSFTTQLLSIKINKQSSIIYSFHQEQTIEWKIQDYQVNLNYLNKTKTPYHVNKNGEIEGYGKKINKSGKNNLFTVIDYQQNDFIVTGDDTGTLNIYDYHNLGHLKTFKKHLGPILTIKIDKLNSTIYYTGSDSKVVAIRKVNQQWLLSGQVRGQSHDIFSLQLINNTLISGGLTTDICCYPIYQKQQLLQTYYNKISYSSEPSVQSIKSYILVNKITSFQLWKTIENPEQQQNLQFLIRYQLPSLKFIKDIKISKKLQDSTHLIIASSEIDTIGWKFTQENGLTKIFTIKNSYDFIQFIPGKAIFIGLRDTGDIQKVHCNTGKIDQIIQTQINIPTTMKLLSEGVLLVGSNLSHEIKIFDLKKKVIISKHHLNVNKIYQTICEKSDNEYVIKYLNDNNLYSANFTKKLVQQTPIFTFPQPTSMPNTIRYSGLVNHRSPISLTSRKYWYFATQSNLLLLNNLNKVNKKKNLRHIYTRQIGTVFKPRINKNYQIGVIHLNFKRMINQMQIKPLLAKKIV